MVLRPTFRVLRARVTRLEFSAAYDASANHLAMRAHAALIPKAREAATSMKIAAQEAQDMLRFGVIDAILREPSGGAHRDPTP